MRTRSLIVNDIQILNALIQFQNQKLAADYLGIGMSTVSKKISQLRKDGVIDKQGKVWVLLKELKEVEKSDNLDIEDKTKSDNITNHFGRQDEETYHIGGNVEEFSRHIKSAKVGISMEEGSKKTAEQANKRLTREMVSQLNELIHKANQSKTYSMKIEYREKIRELIDTLIIL